MDRQNSNTSTTSFPATMLYLVCLVVGLLIGYLIHGNAVQSNPAASAQANNQPPAAAMATPSGMPHQMPTLEQMKTMADKKADPLLQQLKTDPKNAKLLFQIGMVYESAHQFKDAVSYFDKSLTADPKDVNVLVEKASCLYYSGDADQAIASLNAALQYSPNDARTLFNLGMVRWQGKGDSKGAIELWQKLLKTNPALDVQKKAQVESLIKQVSTQKAGFGSES
jgi:cytochrome c-type biogenesis protein CcmH/NrfG